MSLYKCPECGSDISDKACVCPSCGYSAADPSSPISQQECLAEAETRIVAIGHGLKPRVLVRDVDLEYMARQAYQHGGELRNLLMELVANVEGLMGSETQWVARITPAMRRKLRSGELEFLVGQDGDVRAMLRDVGKKTIRKQVPLDAERLAPEANQALNNLLMASMVQQVLLQIEGVRQDCAKIQEEIRGDRHALGIAAIEALAQANMIQDRRLRSAAVVAAIQSATVARAEHMGSFERIQGRISERHEQMVAGLGRNQFLEAISPAGIARALPSGRERDEAVAAFEDLEDIMGDCYAEVVGWLILGEREAAAQALDQVRGFIGERGLDDKDTLLKLNSAAQDDMGDLVDDLAGLLGSMSSRPFGFVLQEHPECQKQIAQNNHANHETREIAERSGGDGESK